MKRTHALRIKTILPVTAMLVWIAGCSSTLETGYKPRPLGAGDSQRRAYYAQPFSPESQGKGGVGISPFESRRPDAP